MTQEEKKYSILDELANCSGFDIALMTTFNFEIGFFERAVLNRLYAKDVKRISLFVDSRELTNALNEVDIQHTGSYIGKKYMVNPVHMNRSFHPKVILLLGEKKARLFVGSANIKTSGYAMNNEVFNFIDYSPEHPEYLDAIVSAIDFFHEINEISYKLDNEILKAAKEYIYYHRTERNGVLYLLHNMTSAMLSQVAELISGEVESVSIAVPYYDKELLALQSIKESFPTADIHLYIQNKRSTFPIDYNAENHIADKIHMFCKFKDNTSSSGNFYHGKVFLFKTKDAAYILYGSANCTQSAFTKTYASGGNIECDFFEIGNLTDFDYFFDNMDLEVVGKLTSQIMIYETQEPVNFTFKFGEEKGDIELHIGFSKKIEDLVISVSDKELDCSYVDDELIVTVLEEYRDTLPDIFDISIKYDDKEETLRCWSYSPAMLANNRASQSGRDEFGDFDLDTTGDKYLEDRIKFFRAEATCLTEWQEYKKNQKYMNQIRLEQEGDDGETDEFIVDFQIPDEYRYVYRQYNAVSKIRSMFVRRFLGISFISDSGDKAGKTSAKKYDVKVQSPGNRKPRKATSEERKFERFIKGKVKGMMNDVYVDVIDLEHYIGLVQVVIEIFEKYNDEEVVEDIFTPDYVINTKVSFLLKILGKTLDDVSNKEDMRAAIIKKCFAVILENYMYYRELPDRDSRWKFESLNKRFLVALEKKYNLRQDYKQYVKQVIQNGKGGVLTLGYEASCTYIEQLYGYKNYEMLRQFIANVYDNALIQQNGNSLCITAESDRINDHRSPAIEVLKEVGRYSRSVSKISFITISIKNIAPNPENKNLIDTIKHTINVEYHLWHFTETRKNGEIFNSKSQFISF